jgi:hypothetical protein
MEPLSQNSILLYLKQGEASAKDMARHFHVSCLLLNRPYNAALHKDRFTEDYPGLSGMDSVMTIKRKMPETGRVVMYYYVEDSPQVHFSTACASGGQTPPCTSKSCPPHHLLRQIWDSSSDENETGDTEDNDYIGLSTARDIAGRARALERTGHVLTGRARHPVKVRNVHSDGNGNYLELARGNRHAVITGIVSTFIALVYIVLGMIFAGLVLFAAANQEKMIPTFYYYHDVITSNCSYLHTLPCLIRQKVGWRQIWNDAGQVISALRA